MPAAAGRSASTNDVSLQESNKIGSANRTGLLLMWPRKRAEGQQEKWYVRLNPQPSRGPMLFWPGVMADIDIETTWHFLCSLSSIVLWYNECCFDAHICAGFLSKKIFSHAFENQTPLIPRPILALHNARTTKTRKKLRRATAGDHVAFAAD